MENIPEELEFLRPLVSGWLGKIELARRSRSKWKEIADECSMFYSRSAAAMWNPEYSKKFWKGVPAPRFRVTINKAFELVAVFGPSLIWDVPHRTVESKRSIEIPIELFGDPNDPQVQQTYQQIMAEQQQEAVQDRLMAHLMQSWLNYTPREQPGGGLEAHSYLAVVDALVKGRGVLWVKPYTFPASQRTLTGSFREPPENLYIDPDYNSLDDAKWIALERIAPTWEVERRFNLEKDSLKNRSTLESAWAEAEFRSSDEYADRKIGGGTNDMMRYYEIWSKTGPGSRLTGMMTPVKDHLEDTVGDYAWIVVAPNVPYPLNCPTKLLRSGASDSVVQERFSWPIPCWMDDRWPIEVIDFYADPDSAWPIAPLAPALGELKFLNVMIPHLMNRIWSSSRDFWAVVQPAYDEFVSKLQTGTDQTVFSVPQALGGKMSDLVQVFQQPQTNLDVWKIIDAVSAMFDKRTGLTEFMYGRNEGGSQDRSAETTMSRRAAAGVRPEYMAKRVAIWQSNVAALEAFCTRLFIKGEDVSPLLGNTGAQLWDAVVSSADVERVSRQMQYTIAASSIRRPNKDRDIANINQAIAVWLPIAAQAAAAGGDYGPVNTMMDKWGKAADMDMSGIAIQPPQPDPMVQQMQQQQMQLEMAKLQADVQKTQMDAQAKQAEVQLKQQMGQVQLAMQGQKMQLDAAAQQQKIQLDAQAKQTDMALRSEQHQLELEAGTVQANQDLRQDQQQFTQDMLQSALEFRQKMQQQKELAQIQASIAKKRASQPSAKPSNGRAK
jgi:hypothetical protein